MTNRQRAAKDFALIIWFYIGWFGCVYFGKWQLTHWSFIFPLLPLAYLLISKTVSLRQFLFLLGISMVGVLFDSAAFYFQLIGFPNYDSGFIPTWLVSMWFLFVTVFPLSHRLFRTQLVLAACLGAVFGPLSYYSGEALEAMTFGTLKAIVIYAIFWGIFFPATHYIYREHV